jgi:hypothetical protein
VTCQGGPAGSAVYRSTNRCRRPWKSPGRRPSELPAGGHRISRVYVWGVEVHDVDDRQYVLASDRDYGLYIFQSDLDDDDDDRDDDDRLSR